MLSPKFNFNPNKQESSKNKMEQTIQKYNTYPEPIEYKSIPYEQIKKSILETRETVKNEEKIIKIDELVEKYKDSKEQIQISKENRVSRALNLSDKLPLRNVNIFDYENLIAEGILNEEKAKELEALDNQIQVLLDIPAKSVEILEQINKLDNLKKEVTKALRVEIEAKQNKSKERIVNLRNKVTEHYKHRINKLENTIIELRKIPEVERKLKELKLIPNQEFSQELQEKIIKEAKRFLVSLETRHARAIDRISELLGDKLTGEILSVFKEEKNKQQSIFDKGRNILIKNILENKGEKQLKDPKEIVPWANNQTFINKYWQAIDFLKDQGVEDILKYIDNQISEKLIQDKRQLLKETEIFKKLFGKKIIIDSKTGKQHMGVFYAAFEKRKENEEKQLKIEKELKAKNVNEKYTPQKYQEMLEQGFIPITKPIIERLALGPKKVGEDLGFMKIERKISSKGNAYLEIVEIAGLKEENGFRVGQQASLNMDRFAW